jgi:membrane-associated phospholipid phosphatase
MTQAMDGALVQHMIATAATWFGAVPSLHGAYPVLLWLLARRERSRRVLVSLGLYGAMMWAATVILNQHYIIDLLAGAALALAAYLLGKHFHNKLFPLTESELINKQ